MASHVCVTVSGPALSFLIYENVKSFCDQEGFLLGEIISHVTDTISDTQIRGEKTETLISVNSLMPLPHSVSFYNGIGKVNPEKLKAFMQDKAKEVIGWYSFRRNSSLVPHLRDKLLHKELCAAIPHVSPEHFTMCLLNTSVSKSGSTHVFNHKFMRYRHSKFEALPMQIHNLGETQPEYKLVPSTACLSESFNNIIASLKVGYANGSDADLVRHIQEVLQKHLRKLINDVESSEVQVAELEEQVETLRKKALPISNENPLPPREDVSNINKLDLSSSSSKMPESTPHHTPVKGAGRPLTRLSSVVDNACSNHIGTGIEVSKGTGESSPSPSPDPFAYVTEMKNQMSQPRGLASPSLAAESSSNNNNNNNNKRVTDRIRGGARGIGRGMRSSRVQQQQQSASPKNVALGGGGGGGDSSTDTFPNLRTRSDASPTASPGRGIPSVKRRGGYAQAVKRPGNAVDVAKALTRSQASNSQEY